MLESMNIKFGEMLIKLFKLRAKSILVYTRYIDALEWGLVTTLRVADRKVVDTPRVKALLLLLWQSCREEGLAKG